MRHAANTIEEMQKLLLGYRDNMRVEVETGIAVTAKTVADLRALPAWPDGLALNIHVDLDPRNDCAADIDRNQVPFQWLTAGTAYRTPKKST